MLQNPELHYLDNAATTIVAPEVAEDVYKRQAFVRTKTKNVITGSVVETSYNPTAKFPQEMCIRDSCDTLFGATYMVVSPEHAMVKEWLEKGLLKNADAVTA